MGDAERSSKLLGEPIAEVEPGALHPRAFAHYDDYWRAVHARVEALARSGTTESQQSDTDEVVLLQQRAAEAVINANVDPSRLTPEQHHDVEVLQALAAAATTEANLRTSSLRRDGA